MRPEIIIDLLKKIENKNYKFNKTELSFLERKETEYNKIVDNTINRFELIIDNYKRAELNVIDMKMTYEYEFIRLSNKMNKLTKIWIDIVKSKSDYISLKEKKNMKKLANFINSRNVEVGKDNMLYNSVNEKGSWYRYLKLPKSIKRYENLMIAS